MWIWRREWRDGESGGGVEAAKAEPSAAHSMVALWRGGARLGVMAKKKVKVKKAKPVAKKAAGKKSAAKGAVVKAKAAAAKKKPAPKAKAVAKTKAVVKAKTAAKAAAKVKTVAKAKSVPKRGGGDDVEIRGNQDVETVRVKPKSRVARAGAGSGDLQGISVVEDVDSESEDELLEEGQSFEAGIISGVERAGNEESEVVTHEVLEDDVPREYDDDKP